MAWVGLALSLVHNKGKWAQSELEEYVVQAYSKAFWKNHLKFLFK